MDVRHLLPRSGPVVHDDGEVPSAERQCKPALHLDHALHQCCPRLIRQVPEEHRLLPRNDEGVPVAPRVWVEEGAPGRALGDRIRWDLAGHDLGEERGLHATA
eukprot:3821023-Prymnesium_polylepis.1